MTQEQKDLLLKDLCARLPYGVNVKTEYYDDVWKLLAIYADGTAYVTKDIECPIEAYFGDIKPYLFPISSMTEEQYKEYWELEHSGNMEHLSIPALDWLNKNHIDYRGLIEKGLAIDATNLNIY